MLIKTDYIIYVLAFLSLSGCAVGPDYKRPEVIAPTNYKEEANHWKLAEPRDHAVRGKWWEIYGDIQLNALVEQVSISNQNIQSAEAQYRQALALLGVARARYLPTVTGSFAHTRGQGTSSTNSGVTIPGNPSAAITDTNRLLLNANWEVDLWGRIGRAVESNRASAEASAADLQSALLSIQSTLVQTYFQLRINDAQGKLLEQTAIAYERSLQITQNRYEAGMVGRSDIVQANTQLRSTQAQAIDLGVQRAQLEHAIAVLIGKAPSNFLLKPSLVLPKLPEFPAGLPSELLERRPDIAAAERRVKAANAQIGVTQAAFFPSLILGASTGYQSSLLSNLISLPRRVWSIGPNIAATLFDGGVRSSQKEQAIALFDKSVADYRQIVLAGFQEVEDNLSTLRILNNEAKVQREATQSAQESVTLFNNQYIAGTVSYLNVVTAQATALDADIRSLNITGRSLVASAALLKALGGGWPDADTPQQQTSRKGV
ncbi:putative Outer membrane protein OprM [Candidatus Nitrotoga sp. BS]|uniref:efflux transporter outer membrane subunit n=1 Tax=Candidatus Nitrotoga sp. BS TaxID=2890408 RepID=UPI001EF28D5D|nr:efflux transporter outer membrane subunit [Candidatus Nitrotoga sp. BS]CAH1212051.1 putative Outer membrane protein OprM [Candidatus Nitrotoga sp. BS]